MYGLRQSCMAGRRFDMLERRSRIAALTRKNVLCRSPLEPSTFFQHCSSPSSPDRAAELAPVALDRVQRDATAQRSFMLRQVLDVLAALAERANQVQTREAAEASFGGLLGETPRPVTSRDAYRALSRWGAPDGHRSHARRPAMPFGVACTGHP